jgi:hypothetical protein
MHSLIAVGLVLAFSLNLPLACWRSGSTTR